MKSPITIENQFCGPPDSANGGYACGLLANFIDGPAEVTLRNPPPLDTILTVKEVEKDRFQLFDKDKLIAEAVPAALELNLPEPPTIADIDRFAIKKEDVKDHYYPTCFVCGPDREEGDGLLIFPGPIKGKSYLAASWKPSSVFSDKTGHVKDEIIWATMDCPGGWAVAQGREGMIMLGRLIVDIIERVKPNDRFIVMGWIVSEDDRKIYAGSALYSAEGKLHAKGKATWIELKQPSKDR